MPDQPRLKLIDENSIGNGLDAFRALFTSICSTRNVVSTADTLGQLGHEDLRNLALVLLPSLRSLPVSGLLLSTTGSSSLRTDLLRLISSVASNDFDFNRIKPLLKAAIADTIQDAQIWDLVSIAVVESTPPLRPIPSSLQQTPWSQNTSSFANSSEYRRDMDPVLKLELEHLYVGLPDFHKSFFGDIPELDVVSEAVFRECTEGDNPLFKEGWSGWPARAKESDVLTWIDGLILKLEAFVGDRLSTSVTGRKLLAQPRTALEGSTAKRSMDIGFVNSDVTYEPNHIDPKYRWSHVLVAGELKSNPKADIASIAWTDLARYAREVLAAQDTRRFVLGFTLCGSLMRVWEFDRLGGIASEQFDINREEGGLQFVTTILGFLRMNEEMLGFDPTIIIARGHKYIEIERNGQSECLILDKVMKRAPCIAGRATTCWKAYRKGYPHTPLVIKDSWQYTDRDEEGDLIQEATKKGAINVARYYHHETVRVRHSDDEIRNNVRKRLDVTKATNYRSGRAVLPSSSSTMSTSRKGRSGSSGVKRPSSETDAALPPSKRSCSASPTKPNLDALSNRIHRRVILRDYGKPIYKASSRAALLSALVDCIEGHESLHKAGFLHRDISINNLMMNENKENPSWRAFLIDLDLAIRVHRDGASGAMGKTGTRAFMAIGALLGEQHSFMHDLESFFWVLFWICIHYNGPEDSRTVQRFEKWNYVEMAELAELKKGQVSHEQDFIKTTSEYFTTLYTPLIPWVNKLRKVVFLNGRRWEKEDDELYLQMKIVLRDAITDPTVGTASIVTTL
ncbi:FunK1 protein kinase [Pochonia chlamydosporia 170]|uniref:non-specific serine/threonine protein kinase n=1 Tax=Pochonia chlamydosporia 170 TaxID=1380566 RepID=A0A179F0L4_METCM|nr:FunK1 protein kinase [Pochonia chlamydosporia 170]OAQ58942.2 FunK1 protein kinase [Pochonia chlamydosporia 170]